MGGEEDIIATAPHAGDGQTHANAEAHLSKTLHGFGREAEASR
jgi:hypothetical protein